MLLRSIDITNAVVQQVVKLRDYVPGIIVKSMLAQADKGFSELLESDDTNATLREKYGRMLIEFSRHYSALGLAGKQRDRADHAYPVFFSVLHEKDRRSSSYRQGLAAALTEEGNSQITLGQLALAAQSFGRAQQLLLDGITRHRDAHFGNGAF